MNPVVLPDALRAHPQIDQWLRITPEGRVKALSGKVDIGQGISHALRLIVAEELDLPPALIDMVPVSTSHSPDEAVTSGSLSVQHSGSALRHAAAALRERCRVAFARQQGVDVAAVDYSAGRFQLHGTETAAGYPDLVTPELLRVPMEAAEAPTLCLRSSNAHHPLRPDVAAKVWGHFEYLQDKVLPGLCHGQVFRAPWLQALPLPQATVQTLEAALKALPGVLAVVCDGQLVGVLAETEGALQPAIALVQRRAEQGLLWQPAQPWVPPPDVGAWLRSQPLETTVVHEQGPALGSGSGDAETPCATKVLRAEYERPYLQHASIGLSCALAHWQEGGTAFAVWSHSQGIFNLRRDLALAFGLPVDRVVVSHQEGAGCYGHNGADDVAFDAAWLARHAGGRPVRVQWTREAEMAHAPLGPAMVVELEAALNADGRLQSWSHQVWSQGHGTRPGRGATPALLGAWQTAHPAPVPMAVNAALSVGGGSERNAVPPYQIAAVRVLNHRVLAMPVRVSALRALGAHANVFAAESFMDELAAQAGQDPLAFRLAHLSGAENARARAVLAEAARLAGWHQPRADNAPEGYGRGIAYARYKNTGAYCAVVAELVVTEAVRLQKLWIAVDLGHVVHPDGACNQLEGGAVQAASWSLCEATRLDEGGIASADWASYPIFRFADVPQVHVSLLDQPTQPSLGAGECTAGPVAAAIANAINDAIGVRMRSMPFTADRLMQCAQSQPD